MNQPILRWEYAQLIYPGDGSDAMLLTGGEEEREINLSEDPMGFFNNLGRAGWELVGVDNTVKDGNTAHTTFSFKRPAVQK